MTSNDPFDTPTSDFVKVSDFPLGTLLLFTPSEHKRSVKTSMGESDAVVTDIVALNDDATGDEHTDVMVFQRALVGTLKRNAGTGRQILGVLDRGEAKKGQSAPYILNVPTDAQKDVARKYIANAKSKPAENPFEL